MANSKIKKIALAVLSAIAVFCMSLAATVSAGTSSVGFADGNLTTFKVIEGTQVKIDFEHDNVKNAIRFVTEISKDELEDLSDNLDNVTVTTIIVRTDRLVDNDINNAVGFTVESLDKHSNTFGYKTVTFSNAKGNLTTNTVTDNGEITAYRFNACLYNLTDENYMKGFSARSYITTGEDSTPIYTTYTYDEAVASDYDSLWNIADRAVTANTDGEGNLIGSDISDDQLATLKGFCPKLTVNAFDDNVFTVKVVPDTTIESYKEEITQNATEAGTAYWKKDNSLLEGAITDTVTSETATAGKTISLNMATYLFKANDEAETSYMVATAAPLLEYFDGTFIVPATYNGKPVTRIAGIKDAANKEDAGGNAMGAFHGKSSYNSLFKTKMKKVVLPESVTEIGGNAFSNANYLETIIMPGVTKLENNAFANNNSLKTVVLGNSITTTQQTFCRNTDVNENLPQDIVFSVYALNDSVTVSLDSNSKVMYSGKVYYYKNENEICNKYWKYDQNDEIVVGIEQFEDGACKHCGEDQTKGITYTYKTITVGSNKDSVSGYFVTEYSGTDTEVYVRNIYNDGTLGELPVIGIEQIAFEAISDNLGTQNSIKNRITKIVLPENVKYFGVRAFRYCLSLETVIIKAEIIDSLEQNATVVGSKWIKNAWQLFENCPKLKNIVASSNVQINSSGNTTENLGFTNSGLSKDAMSDINVFLTDEGTTTKIASCNRTITVVKASDWEYDSNGNPVLK